MCDGVPRGVNLPTSLSFAAKQTSLYYSGAVVFGIESANIVGYAANNLDDAGGAAAVAPQFTTVGAQTGIKLKDITPITTTGTSLRRKVSIQLLTPFGLKSVSYRWEGQGGKTWIAEKTTDDMGETVIPAGQGLWVGNTASRSASFRSCSSPLSSSTRSPCVEAF